MIPSLLLVFPTGSFDMSMWLASWSQPLWWVTDEVPWTNPDTRTWYRHSRQQPSLRHRSDSPEPDLAIVRSTPPGGAGRTNRTAANLRARKTRAGRSCPTGRRPRRTGCWRRRPAGQRLWPGGICRSRPGRLGRPRKAPIRPGRGLGRVWARVSRPSGDQRRSPWTWMLIPWTWQLFHVKLPKVSFHGVESKSRMTNDTTWWPTWFSESTTLYAINFLIKSVFKQMIFFWSDLGFCFWLVYLFWKVPSYVVRAP